MAGGRTALLTSVVPSGGVMTFDPGYQVFNVMNAKFEGGARGNGSDDDTVQVAAAIAAAVAAGGGTVYFPPGTYKTTKLINGASGVFLLGAGRGITTVASSTVTASHDVFRLGYQTGAAISNFGVASMTIQAPTTVDFVAPLHVRGSNGVLRDLELVGGTQAGLYGNQSSHLTIDGLYIHGQRATSTKQMGSGIWLFKDVHDVTLANVRVDDVDSGGVFLDAGTSDALGVVVTRVAMSNLIVTNYGKWVGSGWGGLIAGVEFQGAQYCTLAGFVIDGQGPLYSQGALNLQEDQAAIGADFNTISDGIIRGSSAWAVDINGCRGNLLRDLVIEDVNQLGSADAAIAFRGGGNLGDKDCVDNRLEGFVVRQPTNAAQLAYLVRFNGGASKVCSRNVVRGGKLLTAVATEAVHKGGTTANVGGLSNTNIVERIEGYNPVGLSAISVTASPFTYTAGESPEVVYISGGTVSAIVKGATTLAGSSDAAIARPYPLSPGQSLILTYSVVPTMTKDVL